VQLGHADLVVWGSEAIPVGINFHLLCGLESIIDQSVCLRQRNMTCAMRGGWVEMPGCLIYVEIWAVIHERPGRI
jgi:hypothetical protein